MVHRPADSRLLTNLLQQEKEYIKQLNQVLDTSNVSLASFGAYAAASPRPASQVIMSVAGSLAAADEALRRYVHGVEEWRDAMRALKDAEDEVGNIMRDREILVTRLIKASKSHKSGSSNFRDSLLLGNQRFPSSSSLSSSFLGQQDSPSPSSSRPLSAAFSSSKLAAAQTELQACETHLAAKERELELKRNAAIRDGLGARAKAMMECGWAWSQLGKDSLRALEELKAENVERRASYIHEPYLGETLEASRENTDPHSTRPSFDLSSIGPSQSASQVNLNNNDIPPAVHIGSIMNSGLFGEPSARQEHNENTQPNNDDENHQPHETTSGLRPSSGVSTTLSSVSATPATYKVETVTYAAAVAVHVPGREASSSAGTSSPQVPTSSELFKDDRDHRDSHNSVRIPAPHALEGYAFDIPTAVPDRQPVAGPSGQQQNLQRRTSSRSATPSASGRSTPQTTPLVTPQPAASYPKRHVLERRITEEEMRSASQDTQRGGEEARQDDGASSTEDELEQEGKLIQEGKLEVVENPRFLTESRKKELEKEEREKAEEAKRAKGKGKAKDEDEDGETKGKEKKRFPFFHSHSSSHSHIARPAQVQAVDEQQGNGHVSFATPESPLDEAPKSSNASPSKGFLGSIKGLFVSRHPKDSPSSPLRTKFKRDSTSLAANEVDDLYDSDDDQSPTTRGAGGGLQNLFRGSKDKERTSSKWQTRTDKNIQQLTRKGSFDDGSVGRRGVGLGAALEGGLAGNAVANVGVVNANGVGLGRAPDARVGPRTRAASDVGVMTSSSAGAAAGPAGRKLKKNRTGPPVAPSASGVALSGDDKGTAGPVEVTTASRHPPADVGQKTAAEKPPVRAVSTSVPPASKATGKPAGVGNRRSASVDVNPERRDWVQEESPKDSGDMIVDLGWRRRTASEVGGPRDDGRRPAAVSSPPPAIPASRPVIPPVKPFHGVLRTTPTKDYSSDSAAVVSAPAVTRKKSLTKKKNQVSAGTTAPPPVPVASSSIPLAAPVQKDVVNTPSPARKSSMKTSGTPTPVKTSPGNSGAVGGATVMRSGGDRPSGTLVSQPGWTEQAQVMGGGLSRNSSITSSASAPSGPGTRAKRQTTLGQGMGGSGLGRRSSLGNSSQVSLSSGKAGSSAARSGAAHTNGAVVQATPAVPSLMSIVEDVARVNRDREGWSRDLKVQKNAGGVQKPTGMIELVKAPPSLGREELRAMDAVQVRTLAAGGQTSTSITSPSSSTLVPPASSNARTPPKISMFEIKAPGSVFDQRAKDVELSREASASAPTLVTGNTHQPAQTSVPKSGHAQPRTAAVASSSSATRMLGTPLRSALKSSRSPSPVGGVVPSTLPMKTSKDIKGKGKAPVRPTDAESGDNTDESESYETGNEFYSDQEEVERAGVAGPSSSASTLKAPIANGGVVPRAVNGQHPENDGPRSDISHSTSSTVLGGSSLHTPSSQPRRRKSVRVSLQPTFSPSPPAIEYESEEEEKRYSPWSGASSSSQGRASGRETMGSEENNRRYSMPAPLPAPVPVRAAAPTHVGISHRQPEVVYDMWQDSGSDEDEQYVRAKRLLTRAAKREKDVSRMVANKA
ncbi:hypothetical protein JR316_0012401 [Psilocybe cubensis]|uniref:Uncharacterized protein n=2 Tax=Psilocybe cubensis TaxID=181762 RepID=A0A8H7XRK5_PSICU|nr:hypothetical protein JR316_0012401 [Psilocybe cubensis]KAH9475290.1 hypothetical protein JR316_0012401 [Psilocybe cubensis]